MFWGQGCGGGFRCVCLWGVGWGGLTSHSCLQLCLEGYRLHPNTPHCTHSASPLLSLSLSRDWLSLSLPSPYLYVLFSDPKIPPRLVTHQPLPPPFSPPTNTNALFIQTLCPTPCRQPVSPVQKLLVPSDSQCVCMIAASCSCMLAN